MKRLPVSVAVALILTATLTGCEQLNVNASPEEKNAAVTQKYDLQFYGTECVEQVPSETGGYCHLGLTAEKTAELSDGGLDYDGDFTTLNEAGFTADVIAGLRGKAANFAVSEYVDSTAAGVQSGDAVATWAEENEHMFVPGWDFENIGTAVLSYQIPGLIEDGGPRSIGTQIVDTPYGYIGESEDGTLLAVVTVNVATDFRVTDEAAIEWMLNENTGLWPDGNDPIPDTREQILEKFPYLAGGTDNTFYVSVLHTIYYTSDGLIGRFETEPVDTGFYGNEMD